MTATLLSLALNAFFKFVTPYAFDFAFDRAEEMLTGVLFPIIILTVWEIYARFRKIEDERHQSSLVADNANVVAEESSSSDNSQSLKVIGIGIGASGVLILGLGLLADTGQLIVAAIASVLILIGGFCLYKSKK